MVELIVAAGLALQAAGTVGRVVAVRAEGVSVDSVTCRVVNDHDPTAASRARHSPTAIVWTCKPGDRLQCEAPDLEPIDLNANACAGSAARLRFRESGKAMLELQGAATVEWRAENPTATSLLAARRIEGPTAIPVAVGGRIIRVHRDQASPVSIHVMPGRRITVERPRSGGELFGRIQKKIISPVGIRLEGPFETEAAIDTSGRFAVAGLPPGEYQAAPLYTGGIQGPSQLVTIRDAQTSEHFGLGKEAVGGVVLGVAPEMCKPTDRLTVTRVQARARSTTFERALRKPLSDGCEWHLEGLRPGRYEATIHESAHNDLRAAEEFSIEAERLIGAIVDEPPIVVEGTVTLGEEPAAGLLLAFERANNSGRTWITATNRAGAYRVAVDLPGSYAVEVRAARRLGADALLARLRTGLNRFDIKLPSTRLTVTLRRSDGREIDEIVQVHIGGLARSRSGFVLPNEGNTLEFAGIPEGDYVVTADTNSGLVATQPASAAISKATPEASVALTLAVSVGELRLVSGDGSPVQGGRAQIGARILDEQQPGVYELKSVSPGSEILVHAPGFVPMCHVLTADKLNQTTLVMVRGSHAAEIHFTPAISNPIGEIIGLPGSTCPVPLAFTSFSATEDTTSTTVRVVGLPEGIFSYRPTAVTPPQMLQVPGPMLKFTRPKPRL